MNVIVVIASHVVIVMKICMDLQQAKIMRMVTLLSRSTLLKRLMRMR